MINSKANLISLFGIVVSVLIWFIPNVEIQIKVLICLLGIIISLVIYLILLVIKVRSITRKLCDLEIKHKALAIQFSDKRKIIENYNIATQTIHSILGVAMSNTKEAKISEISKAICFQLNNADDGGIFDDSEI